MSEKDITARRTAAADLIERVINSEISAETAIEKWPESGDDDMDLALHALMHFRDDTDIRDPDKKREASQRKQLKEIARALISDSSDISKETRGRLRSWRFW